MSIKIGIIAEDNSDFDSLRILINRISGRNIACKKGLTFGCGPMISKSLGIAKSLYDRGCTILICVHDLDDNNYQELERNLKKSVLSSPFVASYICIPCKELEAWLLSDNENIKKVFNLSRNPRESHHPETIPSPKEYLGRLIRQCSNKKSNYLNTIHNEQLSKGISISTTSKKCPSFDKFVNFIKSI